MSKSGESRIIATKEATISKALFFAQKPFLEALKSLSMLFLVLSSTLS